MKRFWDKVDIKSEDDCWNWTASARNGYGCFKLDGRLVGAHRFSLENYLGRSIDIDKEVCHKCNNRLCVNPKHLYEGTRSDNVRDCINAGNFQKRRTIYRNDRQFGRGSLNPSALVNEDDVLDIYKRLNSGESYKSLLNTYTSLNRSILKRIKLGLTWKWLTDKLLS